jgi:hypothetical protein
MRDTIADHGWAVQAVLGEGVADPPYAYTIGLSTFDRHPELMIVGLPEREAGRMLNLLGERVRGGERLRAGQLVADVPSRGPLMLLEVTVEASDELLCYANHWYQDEDGPPVRAFQVVWSDDGHLPWEEGWSLPDYAQLLACPAPV